MYSTADNARHVDLSSRCPNETPEDLKTTETSGGMLSEENRPTHLQFRCSLLLGTQLEHILKTPTSSQANVIQRASDDERSNPHLGANSCGTTSAFIHRLPIEILDMIFHLRLLPLDDFSYYSQLYDLILVCKTWASIIEESATFWFLIKQWGPTPHWETILSRSKTHPLVIRSHRVGIAEKDNAILDHIQQWESASINLGHSPTPGNLRVVQRLSTEPAPLLQRFACFGADSPYTTTFPHLFGSQAPNLRHLRLERCQTDFGWSQFLELRELVLSGVRMEGVPLSAFLRILDGWKRLELLDLEGTRFSDEEESTPLVDVALPTLTTIILQHLAPADAVTIIRSSRMPQCTTMMVRYLIRNEEGSTLPLSTGSQTAMPAHQRIVSSADRLTISLKFYGAKATLKITAVTNGEPTFELRINELGSPIEAFAVLAIDWHLSEVKVPITVLISWPQDVAYNIFSITPIFYFLTSTTKLIFQQSDPSAIDFLLSSLSNPHIIEKRFGWIFPDLTVLAFVDCEGYWLEEVLVMLNRRYGDDYTVSSKYDPSAEGVTPLQRPSRLKRLVLPGVVYGATSPGLIAESAGPQCRVHWDFDRDGSLSDFSVSDIGGNEVGDLPSDLDDDLSENEVGL